MHKSGQKFSGLSLQGNLYSSDELKVLSAKMVVNAEISEWEKAIYRFIAEWLNDAEYVEVKTSGSTGVPKQLKIPKTRMITSANSTNHFFDLKAGKRALLCLSADYIAGKMMLVRAFVGGFALDYCQPSADVLLQNKTQYDFTAVVPMQVEATLKTNIAAFERVRTYIVGGAALHTDVIEQLHTLPSAFWSTYGMTETITHVALQALNGVRKTDYYQALEGVKFDKDARSCLRIFAPKLSDEAIQTNDLVDLINERQFRFLGRADFVINSGGIKLFPEQLEQKISSLLTGKYAFSSAKDLRLGEKLVLVVEGKLTEEEKQKLLIEMSSLLTSYERPKAIYCIEMLPVTLNDKIDRKSLQSMVETL